MDDTPRARILSGTDEEARQHAITTATQAFHIRCLENGVDPNAVENAPVVWWLSEEEMVLIHDSLLRETVTVAHTLTKQLGYCLEQIRRMRVAHLEETS
jgi:Leu/Phe-tRNA-protein transferase